MQANRSSVDMQKGQHECGGMKGPFLWQIHKDKADCKEVQTGQDRMQTDVKETMGEQTVGTGI